MRLRSTAKQAQTRHLGISKHRGLGGTTASRPIAASCLGSGYSVRAPARIC